MPSRCPCCSLPFFRKTCKTVFRFAFPFLACSFAVDNNLYTVRVGIWFFFSTVV